MNRARLVRLERHIRAREAQAKRTSWVLRIGEAIPDDLPADARVILLPRKAASVEAWMEQCRQLGFAAGALQEEG